MDERRCPACGELCLNPSDLATHYYVHHMPGIYNHCPIIREWDESQAYCHTHLLGVEIEEKKHEA